MGKSRFILAMAFMLSAGCLFAEETPQDALPASPFAQLKENPQWLEIKGSAVSRDSILVGDQFVWSGRFSMPQDKEIVFAPYAQTAAGEGGSIDVIHDFKLDTLSIRDGIKELEAKLLLTVFDSGHFMLPQPMAVSKDGDTIYIDMPSLDVTNIQIDTAAFQMHDIKGQMKYPITFKEVYPWVLLALAILALVYAIARYIRYRRENRDFFGKPIVQDPPHIVALRELDKIRGQKLWQNGKEKLYFTGITDTLRAYIEGRYGVSAMEKTSTEIMESIKDKDIEARRLEELDELFKTADLVKFAKYEPRIEENEEAIPVAVRFVNSTFMQELEEDKQKEEEK